MSEERKTRWLLGLLAGMLTAVVTVSVWAGSLATRVSNLEQAAVVQASDHDIIVRLDTQQQHMLEELKKINKKLDKLNGDE